MIRFGVHCSTRNGLVGALEEAHALKCEALQIFTRSPRMWHVRVPAEEEVAAFNARRTVLKLSPLVVHTPYLPNLATDDAELSQKSNQALHDDLEICRRIKADYFVIHPGSNSVEATQQHGITLIAEAINRGFDAVDGHTILLLENVAGGGRRIGSTFEELAAIIDKVDNKARIGVCLDTAHALGAGYDVATPDGIDAMLKDFKRIIGLERLRCLHLNDSKAERASHKDRHEHIGKGHIGLDGFKYLIKKVKGMADAGILETPKDLPTSDKENLKALFSMR